MNAKTYLVAEMVNRRVTRETFEALACARLLAPDAPEIILPGSCPEPAAGELAATTGLQVRAVAAEELETYHPEHFRDAIAALVAGQETFRLVLPHTAMGWDLAPRLAIRLGASCITAVEGIDDGCLVRSILGGKVQRLFRMTEQRLVLTVLPGAFAPEERPAIRPGKSERVAIDLSPSRILALGSLEAEPADDTLAEAPVVVAVGRGLGKGENIDLARQLASLFPRAAIGASRGACDAGWLPHRLQIGATGLRVAPALYLACGISGAAQHLAGMREARLIVAINRDPRAAIFAVAHVGIVEDLMTFIPILLEERRRQSE